MEVCVWGWCGGGVQEDDFNPERQITLIFPPPPSLEPTPPRAAHGEGVCHPASLRRRQARPGWKSSPRGQRRRSLRETFNFTSVLRRRRSRLLSTRDGARWGLRLIKTSSFSKPQTLLIHPRPFVSPPFQCLCFLVFSNSF